MFIVRVLSTLKHVILLVFFSPFFVANYLIAYEREKNQDMMQDI